MPSHEDIVNEIRKMLVLLHEFPAETRLTVYRRLDIQTLGSVSYLYQPSISLHKGDVRELTRASTHCAASS